MGLIIPITNSEWRTISERALEIGGEALTEEERTAVKAFFDLCEPHAERAQLETFRERSAAVQFLGELQIERAAA
jgi:hypothetical protein